MQYLLSGRHYSTGIVAFIFGTMPELTRGSSLLRSSPWQATHIRQLWYLVQISDTHHTQRLCQGAIVMWWRNSDNILWLVWFADQAMAWAILHLLALPSHVMLHETSDTLYATHYAFINKAVSKNSLTWLPSGISRIQERDLRGERQLPQTCEPSELHVDQLESGACRYLMGC